MLRLINQAMRVEIMIVSVLQVPHKKNSNNNDSNNNITHNNNGYSRKSYPGTPSPIYKMWVASLSCVSSQEPQPHLNVLPSSAHTNDNQFDSIKEKLIIIKYHIYSVATHFQAEYVIEKIFVTLLCKLRTEIHFYIFKLHDTLTLKLDNDFKFQTWVFVKALIVDYENYMFWSLLIFTRCPRRVKTYFVELREKMEAGQIRM